MPRVVLPVSSNAITVVFNDDKSKLIWEFDCEGVSFVVDAMKCVLQGR